MKPCALVLSLVVLFLIHRFDEVKSENKRKWLDIDNDLFRIEPEAKYTWKQAVAECQMEHSHLINPDAYYDFPKLSDAIKQSFNNYSSFWIKSQSKWKSALHFIGLGSEVLKCNKFDTTFKFVIDDCDKQMGFICQKPLLKISTTFNTKTHKYFVQPDLEFSCDQVFHECEKRHMSLVLLSEYTKNKLLRDYVFLNYGSGVKFWFDFKNETHDNCASFKTNEALQKDSKLGFICQQDNALKSQSLSMRHLILIIFAAVAAIVAIVVFVFIRCLCYKQVESYNVHFQPEEIKVSYNGVK